MPLQLKECNLMSLVNLQAKVIHRLSQGRVEFSKITPTIMNESPTATLPTGKLGHGLVNLRKGGFANDSEGSFMLTKRQVAETLSVSIATVNRLLQRGELRGVHVGRSVRISEAEVEAFLMRGGSSHEG